MIGTKITPTTGNSDFHVNARNTWVVYANVSLTRPAYGIGYKRHIILPMSSGFAWPQCLLYL